MQTEQLLQELEYITKEVIRQVQKLQALTPQELQWKAHVESWSINECLEHLNLYGDFYIPAIREAIKQSHSQPQPLFRSGWLGNYFAQSMLPKENGNKMKTFRNKNPIYSENKPDIIPRFLEQQEAYLQLLTQARSVNLNTVKVKVSISTLLRLKLGDTLRFVIYHHLRHSKQIERVQQEMRAKL